MGLEMKSTAAFRPRAQQQGWSYSLRFLNCHSWPEMKIEPGKAVLDPNPFNSGHLGLQTPRVKRISSKKHRPRLISCPSRACLGPDAKTNAGRGFLTQIFLTRRVWSSKPPELRRFPPKNTAQGSFPVPARPDRPPACPTWGRMRKPAREESL